MSSTLAEIIAPAALSLPSWPESPEPVDATGRSFLIVELGDDAGSVADAWTSAAAGLGPTRRRHWTRVDGDELAAAVAMLRCGARIMIVGPQDDVLLALAAARAAGAEPSELRSFVTRIDVLPVFCAHCRATSRVTAVPGDTTTCPACDRVLEIHSHLSATRGSFLGSDAHARVLA